MDRLGWESCVVVADEWGIASALKFALARTEAVDALAFGHACLNFSPDSNPPSVNSEMRAVFAQVLELDDRTFMRHHSQLTQGFYGEELADRMLERTPGGVARAYVRENLADPGEWIYGTLRKVGKPLLFAAHDPCLMFTREGYDAAVAAFPEAMRVSCREKPSVSPEFAEALREFCRDAL
jgi:hypothetical protein